MKRKTMCKVRVNGDEFTANCGEFLLDAALMNGVDIPHDCRSGYCGACRVNVVDGRVYGGRDADSETIHACQCRLIADVAVEIDDVPESATQYGKVVDLVSLAPNVVEVTIATARPAQFLPGQHYHVQFRGFPARCYSPTFPFHGVHDANTVLFHVSQVRDGHVSSALGREIRIGHSVKLTGPSGSAYLRPAHPGRVILVAGGTGFAPIWSIALTAIVERHDRDMTLIVGARALESLYMTPALCKLAPFAGVTILPVVSEAQSITAAVRAGNPLDFMPELSPSDVIYTAGVPAMVKKVNRIARLAGAKCYADPFESANTQSEPDGLLARAATRIFNPDARPAWSRMLRATLTPQVGWPARREFELRARRH